MRLAAIALCLISTSVSAQGVYRSRTVDSMAIGKSFVLFRAESDSSFRIDALTPKSHAIASSYVNYLRAFVDSARVVLATPIVRARGETAESSVDETFSGLQLHRKLSDRGETLLLGIGHTGYDEIPITRPQLERFLSMATKTADVAARMWTPRRGAEKPDSSGQYQFERTRRRGP